MKIIIAVAPADRVHVVALCLPHEVASGLRTWRAHYGPGTDFFALDCPEWQPTVEEMERNEGEAVIQQAVSRVQFALARKRAGNAVPELTSLHWVEEIFDDLKENSQLN